MLYIPIIAAIENQLQKDQYLRNLRYYRFTIPSSSVRTPFICTPFAQTNEYTSHVHPCITDTITNSCVGNFCDQHNLSMLILVGAARHKTLDADEVLDILQNAIIEQLKSSRDLGGAVRLSEVDEMVTDNFFEITPNYRGSLIRVNIKYQDTTPTVDEGQIKYLLGPEVDIVEG